MGVVSTYRKRNVEEAVEVATSFRREGRYDWFRGQVRDWAPYSSLLRVYAAKSPELNERVRRRLGLFYRWVEITPKLKELLDDLHRLNAVAQHYGIPTHFIDFTTEPAVAGFFAADSKEPPKAGTKACI